MDDHHHIAEVSPAEAEGARSFAVFFQRLALGDAHAQASEALHKVGQSLVADRHDRNSKKKAKLTIEITFDYEEGTVMHGFKITPKLPPVHASKSISFVTDGGNFTESNPKQPDLPHVHEVQLPARREVQDAGAAR